MNRNTYLLVIVAALGYFVDIYDLILFNVVKKESLLQLMPGATPDEIKQTGIFLFNMQMTGMLLGGIFWGIWGDKKGRISVLFGSILLYSLANITNAFVTTIPLYAAIRIIAGIGLAGELGAGITLVAETMSREKRGIGTMIIVTFGALGAVVAGLVGSNGQLLATFFSELLGYTVQNWQVAYVLGGAMGLVLLVMRMGIFESGMFRNMEQAAVKRGDFFLLFQSRQRFLKYLSCILIGVPIWYIIGLLVANSEEIFARELQVTGPVVNGKAVMYAYIGLSSGDLLSGLLSQWLRSRKKVVLIYLCMSLCITTWLLFFSKGISAEMFYFQVFLLGFSTGYWAIFVTIASEQFGTNIRATVTNTVPNFVRGSVPLITGTFALLMPHTGVITAAGILGICSLVLAFAAVLYIRESFDKDLDYVEDDPLNG